MTHKKILALVTSIILLSGCSKQNAPKTESDNALSTSISSAVSSVPQSTQSKVESHHSTGSVKSTAVSSYSRVPEEKPVTVKTNDIPKEISDYIGSLDNGGRVFVDYDFNESPNVITDMDALGDVYDKALKALKATGEYKNFADNFSLDDQMGFIRQQTEDFLVNGVPTPIFKSAYTDDFDSDGKNESFVLISTAKPMSNGSWGEREFLVYVGDSAEVVCDYYDAKFDTVLDYGSSKQMIVRSGGWNGSDSKSAVWGVKDGKAKKLYGGRLGYKKTDCFLYSEGQNFTGDFAVYDTVNNEYLAIQGKELSPETVKAMDKSGKLGEVRSAVMIGGKYYIINTNGVYTYENGEFTKSDKKVRASATPGITDNALKTLADIDYDKAAASMITPEDNHGN